MEQVVKDGQAIMKAEQLQLTEQILLMEKAARDSGVQRRGQHEILGPFPPKIWILFY